jgi:hypothetical protein
MDISYRYEQFPCELYVCISAFFLLNKVPRNGILKNCSFLINKKHAKNGTTKMSILTVFSRMLAWSLSDSSKPWSYGMCSVCKDPKTQKWPRWLALRGCPLGDQDNLNSDSTRRTRYIWTSGTCRINSRVNCMGGTRDFLFWAGCPEMVLWRAVLS